MTENLQELDLSKKGLTASSCAALLEAFRESGSVNNLESLPELDKGISSTHEVVQQLVELIKVSENLKVCDFRGMHLTESATASLLTAMIESESIKHLKHLPMVDKEVCSTDRVITVLPQLVLNSEQLETCDLRGMPLTVESNKALQ